MDIDAIKENLPFVLVILAFILLQFFMGRRRKPAGTQQEIAHSLLTEVKLNEALVETFHLRQKPRKFEVYNWQRNKTKLDFLGQSLQSALSDAFSMAEDFNHQIDAAKKYKSATYTVNINAEKLKEPLAKSKEGLQQWFLSKIGAKEPPTKYPGLFDDWLGRR